MNIKNNQLYIGEALASDIAEEHKTPVYVYDRDRIKGNATRLLEAIPYTNTALHYAVKANSHPEIISLLYEKGIKVETVSFGEIQRCLSVGVDPKDILFTASSISQLNFSKVIDVGVRINIDSLHQLDMFGSHQPGGAVGLRINTGVGEGHHAHVKTGGAASKFGIHPHNISKAKEIAEKNNIKLIGIHHHIGSHILDEDTLGDAMQTLLDYASEFDELEYVDFGGGLGVPYEAHEKELPLDELGNRASEIFSDFCSEYGKELELIFEPGRFFVADAGYLLVTVTDIKKNPDNTFVGVNSGFNHLLRPALYNSYHPIIKVNEVDSPNMIPVDVVGNICESGDVFGGERMLPKLDIGDVLAIAVVGAYGYVMSSEYNLHPKPPEIIV